jgi:cyclase
MLIRRIIPCLDIFDGRVVQGRDVGRLADIGDPVELSQRYFGEGADELVLLDISKESGDRKPFYDIVRRVAERIKIPLTVGGGIRTLDDIGRLIASGANKVSLNTILVEDPLLLARAAPNFGTQALVAAIDVVRKPGLLSRAEEKRSRAGGAGDSGASTGGRSSGRRSGRRFEPRSHAPGSTVPAASDGSGFPRLSDRSSGGAAERKRRISRAPDEGWVIHVTSGTEDSEFDAIEWAKTVADCGAGELLVTSIDQAGTKEGYDLELLRELALRVNLPVIASGGAGNKEHIAEALMDGGADAVLAAGVFHSRELSIPDLKQYLRSKGIPVRL